VSAMVIQIDGDEIGGVVIPCSGRSI
jgi:hypothetical protein